jgi:hypothetical protein
MNFIEFCSILSDIQWLYSNFETFFVISNGSLVQLDRLFGFPNILVGYTGYGRDGDWNKLVTSSMW